MAKSTVLPNGKLPETLEKTQTDAQGAAPAATFAIQRIYTKDLSLESPNSPLIFQQEWKPNADVNLNISTHKLADDLYEVKLSVTVTTQVEDKVAFLVEIHQAGIFNISNLPEEQLHRLLGSHCPTILFPFAREGISDLISRAGFPPLYLAPINFDALYEQQRAQQKDNALKEDSAVAGNA